jgi:hypothetical protein
VDCEAYHIAQRVDCALRANGRGDDVAWSQGVGCALAHDFEFTLATNEQVLSFVDFTDDCGAGRDMNSSAVHTTDKEVFSVHSWGLGELCHGGV